MAMKIAVSLLNTYYVSFPSSVLNIHVIVKLTFLSDPHNLGVGKVQHVHSVDGQEDVANAEKSKTVTT